MNVLVTNNPLAAEAYRGRLRLEYSDCSLSELLIVIRGLIHAGHRLLTHPLSGSVKPNESPYKTVLLYGQREGTDPASVRLIEESIQTVQKFPPRDIPGHVRHDMQTVDLAFIEQVLYRYGGG